MTNLIAAIVITLSTNVTVEDNRPVKFIPVPCPDASKEFPFSNCLVNHGRYEKYGEATEKTETEVVTRKRALRFRFEDEDYDVPTKEQPVEVSRRARVLKLESQWRVSDYTNAPPRSAGFGALTNSMAWKSLVITNNGPNEWRFTPR